MLTKLKTWARKLKQDLQVLQLALADPRTPWYAKWTGVLVVAYALSPIDLIPDFIPVLGYLDDLLLLPLGILLTFRFIPETVLAESRLRIESGESINSRPNWFVGSLIIGLWVAAAGVGIYRFFVWYR